MIRFNARLFLCVFPVLGMAPCLAQDITPSIVFENPTQDMGKITEGETLKHVFKFTNKGQGTLEVLKVEPSCGCTAAVLSAKKIAPGQSGQIEVSIKTENMSALNKTVTVTTNDPQQPQVVLTITAVVEPEFQLSERSIYFGNNPAGKEVTKELTVTIPPDKPGKLTSVESTDQTVTVKMEPVDGSNGKKTRVIATQRADAKEGYHFGLVVIKTSSATTPVLKVPIRGMVSAAGK
jgi:hypothetical protein